MTSYNQRAWMERALTSALNQSVALDEIIVVDDASTDGSADWLMDKAAGQSRLKVVQMPENRGAGQVRNAGLSHATGDYVAFLDGDDVLFPTACETWRDLVADGAPDLCFFNFAVTNEMGDEITPMTSKTSFMRGDILSTRDLVTDAQRAELMVFVPSPWTKLVRRSWMMASGLRFGDGLYEDIPFHVAAICRADRIRCSDRRLITYNIHPDSQLRSPGPQHMVFFKVLAACRASLDAHAQGRPDLRALHYTYRFGALHFILFKSGRIPEDMRPDFARRVLAEPGLTDFPMTDLDQARFADLLAYAERGLWPDD